MSDEKRYKVTNRATGEVHYLTAAELARMPRQTLRIDAARVANDMRASRGGRRGKGSGLIRVDEPRDRGGRRHGVAYEGQVSKDAHAEIVPGKSIRIWGVNHNHVNGAVDFDLTFRIGDTAITGSYNMTYLGKVTKIGKDSVTVKGDIQTRRYTIARFISYHKNFDIDKIHQRNANWTD